MNTTPSKLTDTAGKPATPEIQTLEPAKTGQTNNAGPCSVQRFVLPVDCSKTLKRVWDWLIVDGHLFLILGLILAPVIGGAIGGISVALVRHYFFGL